MTSFFDTNVLVAAIIETHEHHPQSFPLFHSATRAKCFSGVHNLAEVYVTLTRYSNRDRFTPDQALFALDTIQSKITVVALGVSEYVAAIRKFAAVGIVGAGLYDGLIAACALKANVDVLYTWNTTDFVRLGPDVARKVRTPT